MGKKLDVDQLTYPIMGLILVIAAMIFLFSRDLGGITGLQALAQQSTEFWLWVGFFLILAIVGAVYLIKVNNDPGIGWGTKTVVLAIIIISLAAPFAKACNTKAEITVQQP